MIDLPPQTAHLIAQVAKQNGQSIQDFVIISAYEKALTHFINDKPPQELTNLGERIHQIFAKANYPDIMIAPREDYPRQVDL